jgi:hypothetical protein
MMYGVHIWQVKDRGTEGTCKLCGKIVVNLILGDISVAEQQVMLQSARREVQESKALVLGEPPKGAAFPEVHPE